MANYLLLIFFICFIPFLSIGNTPANWESQGDSLVQIGENKAAISVFEQGITTRKDSLAKNAAIYYKISKCYFGLGNFKKVIESLEKAIEVSSKDDPQIARYYNNIAFVRSKRLNQYKPAIAAYEKVIQIKKQHGEPTAKYYSSAAELYDLLGAYAKAIAYYQAALQTEENELAKAKFLANIGGLYRRQNNYKAALRSYQEAEQRLLSLPSLDKAIVSAFLGLGNTYDNLEDYENAIAYYEKATKQLNQEEDQNEFAKILNNIGDSYRKLKNWEQAKFYLEQGLKLKKEAPIRDSISIASSFNNFGQLYFDQQNYLNALKSYQTAISYLVPPSNQNDLSANLKDARDKPNLVLYLADKAKSLKTIADQTNDLSDLKKALDVYKNVDDLVQILLSDVSEKSQLFWVEKTRNIYDNAIETAFLLHQNSKQKKYLKHAFSFIESNKAVVLYRALQKNNVSTYEGSKLLLEDIKVHLTKSDLLIEYFEGKENIYILWLNHQEYGLSKITKTPELTEAIKGLSTFLKSPDAQKKGFDLYLQHAYLLYDTLLNPFIKKYHKRLVLLPDGNLYNFPFAALLTQKLALEEINYNLPYLIQDHQITQGYSVAMLFNNLKAKHPKKEQFFGGYSPNFPTAYAPLSPIPTMQKGVTEINNFFNGTAFLKEVTLNKFLETYSNYDLLYLATHAQMDLNNSDLGLIYFADTALTTERIYQLVLQNELVVLGSCESGNGLLINGEGVMSLARAFMYAGSPSVVSSLWQANEETSNKILLQFFKHLSNGKTKDEALQLAQKEYLKSGTNLQPYYWAAFTHTGNWKSLNGSKSYWFWVVLGLVIIGGLLVFLKTK